MTNTETVSTERLEDRMQLWFFRDLSDEQRVKLLRLCFYPATEFATHSSQQIAFRTLVAALASRTQSPAEWQVEGPVVGWGLRKKGQPVFIPYLNKPDAGPEYEVVPLGILRAASIPAPEHPDDLAVDRFAATMKAKLKWEREERGRSGWQNMTEADLSRLLMEHLPKGDPVDVANFCMMLSENGQRIQPASERSKEETEDRASLIAKMAEFVTHRGKSSYSVLGDHHAKCALQAIEEAGFRVEPATLEKPGEQG